MTAAAARAARARSSAGLGGLGAVLVALACLLLTAFFFVLRFPVDRFRESLVAQLGPATGAEVSVGALRARPGLGGLTLVAEPLALAWPGGTRVELARAAVRPAWSLSWLRGRPAVHVDAEAPLGRVAGTVWPVEPVGFDGELEGVLVERLPAELLEALAGLAVTGRLDADVALERSDGRLVGDLELEIAEGSIAPPGAPLAVPFERLVAQLALAETGAVEIEEAQLEGPMLAGEAHGALRAAPHLALAPLELEVDVVVRDAALRSWLIPLGVALDAEGRGTLRLSGTLSEPLVR